MTEFSIDPRAVFEAHRIVLEESARVLPSAIEKVAGCLERCLRAGGKILVCGNGGSAADAQHFASELVGRLDGNRRALSAIALTTDGSSLTAIANDTGFANVFARQVEALAREGDTLAAISTSGRSANVLLAADRARSIGCTVVALTGSAGAELLARSDLALVVPSTDVQRVQEMHTLCLHALARMLEVRFAEHP